MTSTEAVAINNSGEVVGTYTDGDGSHIFTYSSSGGTYAKRLSGTGAEASRPARSVSTISGEVIGNYWSGGVEYGFLDQDGTITTLSYAGATATQVVGIDDAGEVVGDYTSDGAAVRLHLYRRQQWRLHRVQCPVAQETVITGINSSGEIAGYYFDLAVIRSGSSLTRRRRLPCRTAQR